MYGIAVQYDVPIDPASLALDTYTTSVFPAARGFVPGMPQTADKNATSATAAARPVAAVYTNSVPALLSAQKSVSGMYVIAEFAHDPDLSKPTSDSDKVRMDKVLKIDPKRVYCTGWSMGAMTSLWMMAKHPKTFAAGLIVAGQQRPSDVVDLAKQKVLIITGTEDTKATPWNEKSIPVWEKAGGKVVRPAERLDPALIFPLANQKQLNDQINGYLDKGANITFLTFAGVDHPGSARKFFYIRAAKDWLFKQVKA